MAAGVDVCTRCSDNFIVNSKFIACDLCKLKSHAICVSIKDTWVKVLSESENLQWFCDICKNKWQPQTRKSVHTETVNIMNKEIECLKREQALLNKIQADLDYTCQLQKKIIKSYEEKQARLDLQYLQEKTDIPQGKCHTKSVNNAQVNNAPALRPPLDESDGSRSLHQTTKITTRGRNTYDKPMNSDVNISGDVNSINKNGRNEPATILSYVDQPNIIPAKSNPVNIKSMNVAVLNARQNKVMRDLQELGGDNTQGPSNSTESDWETIRYRGRGRNRKFLIGRDETRSAVRAVPKFVSLHISRLQPNTKPEDLENFLKDRFPEVKCEEHRSKQPEIYASMKVTINQDHFKEAWKREVWPSGALVSRFFLKRRVPLTGVVDPQR